MCGFAFLQWKHTYRREKLTRLHPVHVQSPGLAASLFGIVCGGRDLPQRKHAIRPRKLFTWHAGHSQSPTRRSMAADPSRAGDEDLAELS